MAKSKTSSSKTHLVRSAKKQTKHPKETAAIAKKKNNAAEALFVNPSYCVGVNQWKLFQTIGEKQSAITTLHQKQWDFSHLQTVILELLERYSDGALFVFGGQLHPYQNEVGEARFVPTFSVIHVPVPKAIEAAATMIPPPPVLSIQNPQQGTDELSSMKSFHLAWAPLKCSDTDDDDRVFVLQRTFSTFTRHSEIRFEYVTLFTMIPSQVCPRREDRSIDLRSAKFSYALPNDDGEVIEELYTKGEDSFSDFCQRYELDEDQYIPEVKAAVKKGFDEQRGKLESRLAKLKKEKYSESMLEDIRVVAKIYPRNDELNNGRIVKSSYVNQYYGSAIDIFPQEEEERVARRQVF